MADVKLGTRLGANWHKGIPSPQGMLDIARQGEEWGYDFLVSGDHIAGSRSGSAPIMHCIPVITAAAAVTQKMMVGTCIIQLAMYNPAVIARMMLTLDYLSEGRAFMGIGVGGAYPTEWEAAQSDLHSRGKRTDEALVMIKKLWTEDSVDFQGEHYNLTSIGMAPKPRAPGGPPIRVGGLSEAALRRAARFGDGWTSTQMSPEAWAGNMGKIQDYAAEMGRDLDDFQGMHSISIHMDPDREKARQEAREWLGDGGRIPFDELVEDYAAVGDAQDCVRVIRKFVDAGAGWIILSPMAPVERLMSQLEMYSREFFPLLR